MSTHNICFRGEIRKNVNAMYFWIEKSILSSAINKSILLPVDVSYPCLAE